MKLFPIALSCLLMTGCAILQPVADDPVRHLLDASISVQSPRPTPAVAIARPSLPPYLERLEFVTRTGDGRLELHEKHVWSEPLDAGIARVIAENLRYLTASTSIQPSSNYITQDYAALVEVRIDRFDPRDEGTLLLECTWKTQPLKGGDVLPVAFRTEIPISSSGDSMQGRVAAMNEGLARLSRIIAESL